MARTTNKKAEMPEEIIVDNITATPNEEPQLNLEQQITVTNIAGWIVGFARLMGIGDVNIPPRGSVRLSINEVISQVQNGNKLFTGIDGFGNHATIVIEDKRVLRELGTITVRFVLRKNTQVINWIGLGRTRILAAVKGVVHGIHNGSRSF